MTTIQTLTITSIVPCDGGQCGGEVTITTDTVSEAYAVTTGGARYTANVCEAVLRKADGTIEVSCAAQNADRTCDGVAVFTPDLWTIEAYEFSDDARFMVPMDHEES